MTQAVIVVSNGYHQLGLIGPMGKEMAGAQAARLQTQYPSLSIEVHPLFAPRDAVQVCTLVAHNERPGRRA